MEQADNVDMEQVEFAFKLVASRLVNQYLGPLGFDITYKSPRVCEAESKRCIVAVQVDRTSIQVTLMPKPEEEDKEIIIDCRPTHEPFEIEITQEVTRQLQLVIDNYGHLLRGELDR